MNQQLKTLTALIALATTTAFAAGSPQGSAQSTTPAAPTTAPQAGQPRTPGAGQPGPVCAPMKGQLPRSAPATAGRPSQTPGDRTTTPPAPGNTAQPVAPSTPGKAPVRPAAGALPTDCGPDGAHHPAMGPAGQRDEGPRGGPMRPGQPGSLQPAPPSQADQAARFQTELTRIEALLASSTDPKVRGYLTDARAQAQSGHFRAAQALLHAAEAVSNLNR